MIYILMIWTVVGYAGTQVSTHIKMDWRTLGEFHTSSDGRSDARQLCEEAARQLGINSENYRCVRSK